MTLVEELLAASPRLSETVRAETWRDPFWQDRYGDHGVRHTRQDGEFHVKYLVEALAANDDRVFVRYARWLRDLLTPRGMCSRHVADHFDRLASAIAAEPWTERDAAIAVLRAGTRALSYTSGDAGSIDTARGQLAERAARTSGDTVDDQDYLLSYLCDALAAEDATRFSTYVTFLEGHRKRRDHPISIATSLGALASVVSNRPAAYVAEALHDR